MLGMWDAKHNPGITGSSENWVGMTGLKNAIGIIYRSYWWLGLFKKGCNINAKQASDVHNGIIRQKRQEKTYNTFVKEITVTFYLYIITSRDKPFNLRTNRPIYISSNSTNPFN